MKTLSIKRFSFTLLLLTVSGLLLLFYNFYLQESKVKEVLMQKSLQTTALELNTFLRKNFDPQHIGKISSQLDSRIVNSQLLASIEILNEKNEILYASSQHNKLIVKKNIACPHIATIMQSNLSKTPYYDFTILHFKGLTGLEYRVILGIDLQYVKYLLNEDVKNFFFVTLLFSLLFSLFIYFLLTKYIIVPLEALRNYAYYSEYSPQKFFIKEFESIRYSLHMTFKRLKSEQDNLYNLSTRDPLTQLYNRNDLRSQVKRIIASSKRAEKKFATVFLDLDNFKDINDSIGHHFGDMVLKRIADYLRSAIRENDVPSRIGGDEFLIILPEIEDEQSVIEVIKRIQEQISVPIQIQDEHYSTTVSMGIAMYPQDGEDFNTLLKHADIAMYKAKTLGKNTYQFFTNELNEILQEKIKVQSLIVNALENGYFKLFYQPKVDIATNKITGCEALIRLVDPQEGIIAPDKFITIAEDTGMIIPIGEWIIHEACSQIQKWNTTALRDIKVSINVSSVQLQENNFFQILKEHIVSIESSKLDIELTESVLIKDFDDKIELLNAIKKLGVSLSLDDFGTGYSSLSYLRDIPFDTLKIDKSFIDNIEKNTNFIRMIIGIAEDLDLSVVAEGVEIDEQLTILRTMNCEIYQGYLCSKPLPVKQFEELYKQHTKK